ncbi:MAG: DUF4912 domain-containing protein [Spirochaetales bacterium]|nr:DUF4912 domain-containing protein [Spirochaetales bacterium]
MTKEKLQELTLEALQELANREDVSFTPEITREALIELILEEEEDDKSESEKANSEAMRVKERKFENVKGEAVSRLTEYELPDSYNETKITFLLRDPLWAFAYWDIKESHIEKIESLGEASLILRVYQVDEEGKGTRAEAQPFEIPVKLTDRKWYINLPKTGLKYRLKLILRSGTHKEVLCESNTVESPAISLNPAADYVSDEQFRTMLAVSGILDPDDSSEAGGIPQRIISLLDNQYLQIQG